MLPTVLARSRLEKTIFNLNGFFLLVKQRLNKNKNKKKKLTWSRRRGSWIQQGKWWLQTPGHTGWVEMVGEEQKQDHLLLPQPPHHWSPASETEREGRKTEREVDIYCLPTVKGAYRSKWRIWCLFGRRGHDYRPEKKPQHYAKQQLNGIMRDSLCLDAKYLPTLIQSLQNRGFLFI